MKLQGRRVLVTGASRGIGAGLARGLVARGADVALVARDSEDLRAVATETGGTAYAHDLSDLEGIATLAERVAADGDVDVLVNNAGIANVGWFADRTYDEVDRLMRVNLLAPMQLTREVLPGMLERGRGQVVNVSSMAAVFAPPGLTAYGTSKAGLSHFTAGLRADLRDSPLTFTTVHLAAVATEMDDEARSYGPLRELAEAPGGDIGRATMEDFVATVLDAVERDRPEVRVPKMMAPLAMATNLPRRLGRLMFRGVADHEARSD